MQDNTDFKITEREAERLLMTMRYQRLHQEAYHYPARQDQIDMALAVYLDTLIDVTLILEETVADTLGLIEICEWENIPDWMMTGAPNLETYRRWIKTGRV